MFVLVTGSRSWKDREEVRQSFESLPDNFILLHGGAPGLDTIAGEVYKELTGRDALIMRPDYKRYFFKVAPLMRNVAMVNFAKERKAEGEEVLVIAYKDLNSATKGTNACLESAELAGLPTRLIQKAN